MDRQPNRRERPLAVTFIALFQVGLAAYLLYFLTMACINPDSNVAALHAALAVLIGRTGWPATSFGSHGEALVGLFFNGSLAAAGAIYCCFTGYGIWILKKDARSALIALYAVTLMFWARGIFVFGAMGGFSRVPQSQLQPIYMVIVVEALICLTLAFHGGVAEAFGEKD